MARRRPPKRRSRPLAGSYYVRALCPGDDAPRVRRGTWPKVREKAREFKSKRCTIELGWED